MDATLTLLADPQAGIELDTLPLGVPMPDFGSGATVVPIPGTLILLGSGLASLAAFSRRKLSQKA